MGCLPSKPAYDVTALQAQVRALQAQLAAIQGGAACAPPLVPPGGRGGGRGGGAGGGGLAEVLFFPDAALPCHYGSSCRRRNCNYAHQPTSLTRLLQFLSSARSSLDVCVFTITCDEIADTLLAAHKRGVRVRVISDDDQSVTTGSDVSRLAAAGVAVEMDSDSAHMHHKFCVVDGRLVINGSFNWTRAAVLQNQENVVISDNPALVQRFTQQFELLWRKYKGNAKR